MIKRNQYIKRIFAVVLFGICVIYMIASSKELFDIIRGIITYPDEYCVYPEDCWKDLEAPFVVEGVTVTSPSCSYPINKVLLAIRILCKLTATATSGYGIYLWAWNNERIKDLMFFGKCCIIIYFLGSDTFWRLVWHVPITAIIGISFFTLDAFITKFLMLKGDNPE